MPNNTSETLKKITSKAGWQNGLITKQFNSKPNNSKFAFQYYIASNAFNDSTLNLDAIYFTDTTPIIYIKELNTYDPSVVIKLHKRFWNECRAPLTLIIAPDIIKVLDNYAIPVNNPNDISHIEIKTFSTTEEDLERLADILRQSKLDSEKVLGYEFTLRTNQRVDKKLINQLREARQQLHDKYKLTFSVIHDLLGRSLFTLYLQHRGILIEKEIKSITKISNNFFDLLQSYPKETYILFSFLKDKFNGDLFPISEAELEAVNKNPEILHLIYSCYSCTEDFQSGQLSFPFNLFDFKHIPIELISAIYEEFMSEEDVDNNKKEIIKSKRELGAYYTPQMLVEFVYNEVLPMPSKNDYNYKLKILDPACGSGIFLVEGFKRIIERWKYSNKQTELSKETLSELLLSSIYGIEIHPEAIKITAFSLYLTFLHHMNPKEILRKVKFNPLVYWTKKEEAEQREEKKFGINLLQANTFIREGEKFKTKPIEKINSFFANKFDIVIGNPPWKSGNVNDEVISWAKRHHWDLEGDIIKGFLAYAPNIAPDATIALISSAKSLLFNTRGTDEKFRYRFFSENETSVIVNFAVVSGVLFEKAKQSAALVIYRSRKHKEIQEDENIIYCIPKTSSAIQNRNTITIDASEIKYLPIQEILKPDSKIFKITMFGSLRDLKFIARLKRIKSIDSNIDSEHKGIGLHIKEKDKPFGNERLAKNYFIPSNKIQQYTISTKGLEELGNNHLLYRKKTEDIFSQPIILLNEGTKNSRFCATLIEFDCAYLKSSYGIALKNKSLKYLKALTVTLNSSLANYYFIAVSSSWGVDRNRIINKEAISFPLITEQFSATAITTLANNFDKIEKLRFSIALEFNFSEKIKEIEDDIDSIIYSELKITKNELALIENILNYSNVLKENYNFSQAENPVSINKDITQYVRIFLDVINKQYKESPIHLRSEIYLNNNRKDELICVKFIFEKGNSTEKEIEESQKEISKVLYEINESTFKEHSASIYYRRIIKYDLRNAFYFIKPNEKRFWSKAAALNDADNLIVETLNQRDN